MPWSPPEVEAEAEADVASGDWSPPEASGWSPPEVAEIIPLSESSLAEYNKRFPASHLGEPTPWDTTTELTTALAQDLDKPLFHIVPELTPEEQAALKEASPEEQRKAGYAQGTAAAVNSLTTPINLGLIAGTMGLGAGPALGRAIALGFAVSMGKHVPEIAQRLGEQYALPEKDRDQQLIGQLIAEGAATTGFTAAAGFGGLKPTPKPGEVAGRMLGEQVKRADLEGSINRAASDETAQRAVPTIERPVPPEGSVGPWTPPEVLERSAPVSERPGEAPEQPAAAGPLDTAALLTESTLPAPTIEQPKPTPAIVPEQSLPKAPVGAGEIVPIEGRAGTPLPAEPAQAAAKIEKHIDEVTEAAKYKPGDRLTLTPKEIKSELVGRLEKAIEDAPSEADALKDEMVTLQVATGANYKPIMGEKPLLEVHIASKSGETPKFHKHYLEALQKLPKVEISIPGDGNFKVHNTKESLSKVLEKAKKVSTSPQGQLTVKTRGLSKEDKAWVQQQLNQPPGTSAVGFPVGAPVPAIPPPTPAPGTTMIQGGRLPVTLPRTGEGSVSIPQIMQSLVNVQRVAGSDAGNIRTGRLYQRALGIFKPHEEVIRLGSADSIPTATHEVGHALQKQLYGSVKASGLRTLPFDVRRELQGMGKNLYGSRKPVAGYTGEGFAEFMRYWLTTEDAAKVAPKTTAFFESQVLTKYPDVANALKDARAQLDIWRYQGSVERARRQLVREPGTFSRIAKALGSLVSYQGQFESGAPLEAVSKAAARKLGRPLPPSQDPFKIFSVKRGSAGATVERMAMNNMLDIWGNPVGPSLAEALAPVKGQRKQSGLYLFDKAAEMRWRQGKNPGISLEDAQHIKATYDSPEFQIAAQKYFDWQNGLLDYLVQADPSMADTVAKIRANDFYVPLARLIDPAAAKRAAAQARSNPLMRMHGSGLPVKDIFDQTFLNAARLVNRAHKSMVTNAVVKVAEIPGLGHLIEEVPQARVMEGFNFEKIRDQLEGMGVDTSSIPPDEMIQYASLADKPKGSDPIISVKTPAGDTKWYHVDPRLYDALEGLQTYSLKNALPGIPGLGVALDLVLGAPARAFRLGTTGLRAPFSLITNPTRDLQTLIAQTSVNPARVAAEYPAALASVIREGFGGKAGPEVQAFYNLAAHMGQPLGLDISHTKRVSNELFHGRILRVVKNPVDHLRQLLSITEAAPRVAELTAIAREVGWTPGTKMTPDQSVQMGLGSKQSTVDFSASGNVSRIINAAVPFYNPAVQGLRAFGRALRDHPGRSVLLGAAVFTAPALLNWWKNKDKEWYKMLPWRERYTYTNIDDGANVWRIPRPFEWGNAFQVMPEALLDSWYRRDPEAVKQAIGHVFETTNPVDLPVLAKIAKEQWSNRIAFWDRPIVPRGEQDLPAAMQVGPYTTKLAVAINRAFPGLSPRRVDSALRSYFGGTAGDLTSLLGLGASQVDREWERSDVPILGTLFRRGGEFNAQNQAISDFYDAWLPAKAKVDAQNQRGKAGTPLPAGFVVTPADHVSAKVGEEFSQAITVLLRLANSAKEQKARQELYRTAGDLANQANAVMKNAAKANQPP